MDGHFIDPTPESLADEHLCCIIRSKKPHPGAEAKRRWLTDRLQEGHVFRKLQAKATVSIEYAPLETAWVPIEGDNYLYLYCLWVDSAHKGQGYGRALMEHCLADARARGRSGACMLGAEKQKSWSSDQSFAGRYGSRAVDATPQGYRLLAHSFGGTVPRSAESAKRGTIEEERLTIYYDAQCPYVWQSLQTVRKYCEAQGVPFVLIEVDTLEEAKALPCVFNDYAVFYHGRFETVNLLDTAYLKRILKK